MSSSKNRHRKFWLVLALAALLGALPVAAGEDEEDEATKLHEAYEEVVEGSTGFEGLFQLRRKEGRLYADLSKADLGKQFLVLSTIARGISAGDLLGGMMTWGDEWVLEFRRVDDAVQVVRKNIRFQAKKDTPVQEAVAISFSDSILASLEIEGESKSGRVLVELDDLFLSDILDLSTVLGSYFSSGYALQRDLSTWSSVKAFPKNLELEATLTYTSGTLQELETVPDSRYVTLTVHYSLVQLPEDGYTPRRADDRVGHFLTAHKDYSSTDIEGPFVRYVWRWHVEKAAPEAKRSTVKDPIVFYLEKTIPYEYRPYIRQGILEWNRAFARIGLVDAIEVRLQGEDADWDPEDVRYNTVRWITSPSTFAIGPSHVNPFTGQILDSDILIDASWINLWQREVELFAIEAAGPDRRGAAALRAPAPPTRADLGRRLCGFTEGLRHQFALGAMVLLGEEGKGGARENDEGLPYEYIGSALKDLVMHEVGHTLGLRHNFKASSIRTMEELQDREVTEEEGLVGSVMDYLALNLAPEGMEQGEYHPSTLGPYDHWAIEYAYAPTSDDEEEFLSKVASRGTTAALAFASDEDVQAAVDPWVAMWDLGADPLRYAEKQLRLVDGLWTVLLERVVPDGRSYVRARRAVGSLLWEILNAGRIAARFLGGMEHHRDHKGTPGARPAFVPVPAATQRRALELLGKEIFADETYALDPELLNHLAPSHWWHWGESPPMERLDFPFHERVQRIQELVLADALSERRLARMLDLERKVPEGVDLLTVPELFSTLTDSIFSELHRDPDEAEWTTRAPFVSSLRRNLQRVLVTQLSRKVLSVPATAATDAALAARAELAALREEIEALVAARGARLDLYTRGHLGDLSARITQVLEARREVEGF